MNRSYKKCLQLAVVLSGCLCWLSCLKQDPQVPPDYSGYDPLLPVTHSISALKRMNGPYDPATGGDTSWISGAVVISGIVVADDRSGNFYKQLVIQDDSAAIAVKIDANNLCNDFPTGRKIYILCQGLWLGYDGGLPVLGWRPDEQLSPVGLPHARIGDFIQKGPVGYPVVPDTVTLEEAAAIDPALYNKLVYIPGVQFKDIGLSYTQPVGATGRELEDCAGIRMVTRNSNYASFASLPLPQGRGGISGIYTVYISASGSVTPQLVLRDTGDVVFRNPRCGAITGKILFYENFERANTAGKLLLSGWKNIAAQGGVFYTSAAFGGTRYARITGYNSQSPVIHSWLITPPIRLDSTIRPVLSFYTIDGYDNGASLQVLVSADYHGGNDPATAHWILSEAVISSGHTTAYGQDWVYSGVIDLRAFSGEITVAFKYIGSDTAGSTKDRTTTFQIDDVLVKDDIEMP